MVNTQKPAFELIDGHADTVTTAMEENQGLYRNNLHLDLERLKEYNAPVQVLAICCDDQHVENAYEFANSAIDFFKKEIAAYNAIVELALSMEDIERNMENNKISVILALEGAEPFSGDIQNIDYFYKRGIGLVTLTWNRENELGYGVATGSENGLKTFGISCVKRMNELGIIIDVSHLNEAGFWDVHMISSKPYIASHSNAYSITAHIRNLKDAQIKAMVEKGCLIGLNLYPYFLNGTKDAGIDDIIRHIRHFIELGAMKNIGLGCDFDGVDVLPEGFNGVSSLKMLGQIITEEINENFSISVMYGNYYDFLKRFFA